MVTAEWWTAKWARFALALPLLLVHGLLLAVVTGWFVRPWQGLDHAQAQWQALRLMPFYYHYYTTEAVALTFATILSPVKAGAAARHQLGP